MNSSLDDAHNLAWKLALVSRGLASDDLLRTYSEERVYAARENLRLASKSAEFMAPPSGPSMLMRDAVLSLSADHPWVTTLLDPRQHSAIPLVESPLNGGSAEATWASGPAPGDVLLECPVSVHDEQGQREGHLTDLLGPHFTVLCFSQDGSVPADVLSACPSLELGPAPQAVRVISRERPSNHGVHDSSGRLFPLYGMDDAGGVYLVRPDGHVLARWHGMPGLGDELAATIDKTLRGGALAREGAA
jgi:3-(3-hydroxy-phenyl)propionate hydroxylase